MSVLNVVPELVASAASDLANVGSSLSEAYGAAAAPTTGVLPPASDEVSAAITSLFSSFAKDAQALGAQAASFHDQFVALMSRASEQYAGAEAANASQMTPTQLASTPVATTTTFPNFGFGNSGNFNIGIDNTGNFNFGIGNTGSANIGIGNVSPADLVDLSTGNVSAVGGIGLFNNGFNNYGIANTGNNNTGLPLPLLSVLGGVGNTGSFNQGFFNVGNNNVGIANNGSNLYGIGLTGTNELGIGPLYITYPPTITN